MLLIEKTNKYGQEGIKVKRRKMMTDGFIQCVGYGVCFNKIKIDNEIVYSIKEAQNES